jgi:hypothetical protein
LEEAGTKQNDARHQDSNFNGMEKPLLHESHENGIQGDQAQDFGNGTPEEYNFRSTAQAHEETDRQGQRAQGAHAPRHCGAIEGVGG